MVLLIEHPPTREPERAYIARVLLGEFLGLEYNLRPHAGHNVVVTCLGAQGPERLEMSDAFFSSPPGNWLLASSLPARPLVKWDPPRDHFPRALVPEQVPLLYASPQNDRIFEINGRTLKLNIDIFGGAFFLLTRYEEIANRERDDLGRFPAYASVATRDAFLQRPLVNEYLEILWHSLLHLWPKLVRAPRSYRVLLSHDVDVVSSLGSGWRSVVKSVGADLLVRREPKLALRRMRAFRQTRRIGKPVAGEPFNTFDFLMETSEAAGLRSAFNFVAGHTVPDRDPVYEIEQPWIRELMRRIHARGHELGFHPSFGTHLDAAKTKGEFDHLRSICEKEGIDQGRWGGRQHYLRWENPSTWRNWESVGLQYDSTLSFADRAGFRCGCCYEFPVWDLVLRESLALRERPLVAMEVTLLVYMGRTLDETVEVMQQLSDTCRRYRGDFTLLWHNHTLVSTLAKCAYSSIVAGATRSRASWGPTNADCHA